jgi:hypothetical protein
MGNGCEEPWCRACGVATEATLCPACGAEVTPGRSLAQVGGRIGAVVMISRAAILSRPGICVEEFPDRVSVLVKGEEPAVFTPDAFDALQRGDPESPEVLSAPGRLLRAARASLSGKLKSRWDDQRVITLAHTLASASMADKRAALHDWVAIGSDEDVATLGMTATELAWAHAHYAARSGDINGMLQSLGELPKDRYRAKVGLLFGALTVAQADESLRAQVLAMARPFAETDMEANALTACLEGASSPETLVTARYVTGLLQPYNERLAGWFGDLIRTVESGRGTHPAGEGALPATAALNLYRAGMAGDNLDQEARLLRPLRVSLWDDLVEAGALTPRCIPGLPLEGDDAKYVSVRLDPGGAELDYLEAAGHISEQARRMFIEGDAASLLALTDAGPGARHYEALLRSLKNDGRRLDGLRPDAASLLDVLDGYKQSLNDAVPVEVPQALLEDPSCWRLLQREARRGRIQLSHDQREHYPTFATWLALYDMQASVFASDWIGVRTASERLLAQVEEETLRDEVENMAAYAQYQLGNDQAALDILTDALGGRHTEALLVNASIVARQLSADDAAVFLAQLYYEAKDPAIGLAALIASIEIWQLEDRSSTPPQAITNAMRTALGQPLPDETLSKLLRVAKNCDTAWLASDPTISMTSTNQEDLARYFVTLARVKLPDTRETMRDVAVVLTAAKARNPGAAWVARELADMVTALTDLVHVDFGEAAHLVPTITALLDGDVLGFEDNVVLSAQAGAHLAVSMKKNGQRLTAAGEKRFLVDALDRFLREGQQLEPALREGLGKEIERCLVISAYAASDMTGVAATKFGREWDQLVERERYDLQNRTSILRREASVLQTFASEVSRLADFTRHLSKLRLSTEGRQAQSDIEAMIANWQREITRLQRTLR